VKLSGGRELLCLAKLNLNQGFGVVSINPESMESDHT
jgi:hypothetical protein